MWGYILDNFRVVALIIPFLGALQREEGRDWINLARSHQEEVAASGGDELFQDFKNTHEQGKVKIMGLLTASGAHQQGLLRSSGGSGTDSGLC